MSKSLLKASELLLIQNCEQGMGSGRERGREKKRIPFASSHFIQLLVDFLITFIILDQLCYQSSISQSE